VGVICFQQYASNADQSQEGSSADEKQQFIDEAGKNKKERNDGN
jgi:hypothetical protein